MADHPDPARALLHSRRLVVLDFDGPLTRLLPGLEYLRVAAGALELATSLGVRADEELSGQRDHVQLLRALARRDAAAARARPVPAAGAFVAECLARGVAVAVVTNNAPGAVTAVLARGARVLTGLPIHGRDPGALDRLKPAPHMLAAAAREAGRDPAAAVMVGDTASDVQAATAAGMACIGLSPNRARRSELLTAGAAAVARDLAALLEDAF